MPGWATSTTSSQANMATEKLTNSQTFCTSAPNPFAITTTSRLAGDRNSSSSVPVCRSMEKCQADCTSEKKNVNPSVPVARKASSRCEPVAPLIGWSM
ncbi:hypothetical protein GCM10020220_064340 [Nonomuraea rubra]